jgi:hypothetical protein
LPPTRGRIYRIHSAATPKPAALDLTKLSGEQLVESVLNDGDPWRIRMSLFLLAERRRQMSDALVAYVQRRAGDTGANANPLRALWILSAMEKLNDPIVLRTLDHEQASVRVCGLRLVRDREMSDKLTLAALTKLAGKERDAAVCVELLATLASLNLSADSVVSLLQSVLLQLPAEPDEILSTLCWQVLEPIVIHQPRRALESLTPHLANPWVRHTLLQPTLARLAESQKPENVTMVLGYLARSQEADVRFLGIQVLLKCEKLVRPTQWRTHVDPLRSDREERVRVEAEKLAKRWEP